MEFMGYKRPDGQVGIRNKLLIIAVDECCDGLAQAIAKGFQEAVVLSNWYTCMLGGNEETFNQMVAVGRNPNVAGVLVVAMGCGSILPSQVGDQIAETGKPVRGLICQEHKGTRAAVAAGIELLKEIETYAEELVREPCSMSRLVVGIKCGGSDTSSGLASNPSVGAAADLLVEMGGTAIGGELFELQGCEDLLKKRAVSPQVAAKIDRLIAAERRRWSVEGTDVETMSIGNSVGGISTIEEKSLGALHKMGSKVITDVLAINKDGVERPSAPGFYLSEATMLCGGSAVNFASYGAQVIMWTTGGAGFENPIVPVVRISGNEDLFNEDMDVDARGIMSGTVKVSEVARVIIDKIKEIAGGRATAVEGLGGSTLTLYQKDQRLEKCLGLS